ncbi:DUF6402 family protein [Burkholderia lata]|uniref:DUF6402 family protein n=1 Tax=Burkholderia lata (strain ATCC 17760 / DSM 23089 / LMG 22485 / NCIMB 9086 / R18194 / 383) TaxID=482957 RepID=UPI001582B9CB|nr:DUF6402 family protein [Burkholderia lata]
MSKPKKLPYYKMSPSRLPFATATWKACIGSQGCVPINTQQTISYARLAPGEAPPPPPPKPTAEQLEAEAAFRKLLAAQSEAPPKPSAQPKKADGEDHEKIPEFDLQDVPAAMDKIGWPVAAKIARAWFANPKHIYNDVPNSEQPIDNTTVTLKWTLRFGSVRKKYDELINQRVYSPGAIEEARRKIFRKIQTAFVDQGLTDLSFDTTPLTNNARQFHIDWQFQFKNIPTSATLDGLLLTDLTATLGNFNLYVAVGRTDIATEKYFQYDSTARTKAYCIDAIATITHIYVYVKDNYSFNDRGDGNSQYLGHWNKKDMILSYRAVASDIIDGKKLHTQMGNSSITETTINLPYFPGIPLNKPVDTRTGMRKLLSKNVYYPVYNKSYNEWREKHNRGGDFMIYSKPQLLKLDRPIQLKLETICRPSEPM